MARKSLHKDIEQSLKKSAGRQLKGWALKRVQTLASMVYAIISRKKSGIYTIANSLQGHDKQSESRVKQVKRWLDSKWTDYNTHFACYLQPVLNALASSGELVLCIDGSETCHNCICLMLSAYYKRRAIPMAWVVRQGRKGHFPEQMHIDLVTIASGLVPKDCRVVLLGDGEFDGDRLVETLKGLQWEYVLRTRLDRTMDFGNEIAPIGDAIPAKGHKSIFLPGALPHSNAVLWHEPGFSHPIPLITSMDVGWQACLYYKKRFSIETMFSDMKSRGFNIHKAKLTDPERIAKLMIAVALAYMIVFLWGTAPIRKKYQGNIYRQDRGGDLSPFNRGLKIFDYCKEYDFKPISLFSKNFVLFICVRL